MKNIIIISSDYTGHGHKSITESLSEILDMEKDIKIHVIDGFLLGGSLLRRAGKLYGTITRKAKSIWEMIWKISCSKPELINKIVGLLIEDEIMEIINQVNPDLILSVHPNFNGSVLNILEKNEVKIPFATFIADLVSITPLWVDERGDYIISPTEEAKEKCIEFGIPESKIRVLGFPVRSRFCCDIERDIKNLNLKDPFKCLIMSGGEGVGDMQEVAEILLNNFNCIAKIVAGRNMILREKLEKSLVSKYGDKVEIYGFTENIQDLMIESDIAITRGSPNVMMEAIACSIPLIIMGALPGQEEGNPGYAEKYNLGVTCNDVNEIDKVVNDLIINDAQKLNKIKNAQEKYNDKNVAANIVNFILNIDKQKENRTSHSSNYIITKELTVVD
ncbi:MAG: glycosyltransferase [Clostridiaceae bacterium]